MRAMCVASCVRKRRVRVVLAQRLVRQRHTACGGAGCVDCVAGFRGRLPVTDLLREPGRFHARRADVAAAMRSILDGTVSWNERGHLALRPAAGWLLQVDGVQLACGVGGLHSSELGRLGADYGRHSVRGQCRQRLAAQLARAVERHDRDRLLVVFSAHGLPMSHVKKGDPYPQEVEASARGTAERAGVKEFQITYQSRVGPAKWLGPDTSQWLEENARGRAVVTHPIAFVSEHLETLYDMDILAADAARKGGAIEYHRAAAVGVHPEFTGALADLVRSTLASAVPAPRP